MCEDRVDDIDDIGYFEELARKRPAPKDFEKDGLPGITCPVCKAKGSFVPDGMVMYMAPLIYEVRCTKCQSRGEAGYKDLSRTTTVIEMKG